MTSTSAFDSLFEETAGPLHDSFFGVVVTRYPLGNKTTPREVRDVIFEEVEPDVTKKDGTNTIRNAKLIISDDYERDPKDRWLANGIEWTTKSIGPHNANKITINLEQFFEERLRPT